MRTDICIYVSSPYSYKDIFDVYYQTYKKFASSIPLVLSTNYAANYDGIRIISSGDINDSWVSRSISALKQIEAKYVLLSCDDMFLISDMPDDEIYHIVEVMDKCNLNFCRLKPRKRGVKVTGEEYLIYEYQTIPYAKNLQIGIFNREYLLEVLGDGKLTAWDIEKKWLKESHLAENKPFTDVICVSKPILKFVHAVDKGKLYPSAIKSIKKLGFAIKTNREVMSYGREFKQYLSEKLGLLLPQHLRHFIKGFLSKIGVKFTTDY